MRVSRKRFKLAGLVCAILAAMLLLCTCATPTAVTSSDGRAYSSASRLYRDASLVVRGECVRLHIDADGASCYDLRVDEVIAGVCDDGAIIHITTGTMKQGEEYLLYLTDGGDVFHTEDMAGYELMTDSPLRISNGKVTVSGTKLSLADIRHEIDTIKNVISIPYTSYYYKSLADLANAVDSIFIGEVISLPKLAERKFRADEDGNTIENAMPASIARIRVLGSTAGIYNYGDEISLVYAPSMSSDIIDAATLKPVTYGENRAPALEEGHIYLFFLINGPDAKQDYHFAVNPMQGFVELDGNAVLCPYVNSAVLRYRDLDALVVDIRKALA